jgi:hypothetical protein
MTAPNAGLSGKFWRSERFRRGHHLGDPYAEEASKTKTPAPLVEEALGRGVLARRKRELKL